MVCFAAVIGFTIVNMMKIQASNEDEVDALLNVQEAKADLNTLKESITGYSYTLADAQKEDVRSYERLRETGGAQKNDDGRCRQSRL